MGGLTRLSATCDAERPSFIGFRLTLNALFQWFGGAARQHSDAGWPDDLNDHYLRDAGMARDPGSAVSESALHQLRIGPRGS